AAGHELAVGAGHEAHQPADVGRAPDPPHWSAVLEPRADRAARLAGETLSERRLDHPRPDRVHGDAVLAELLRPAAHHDAYPCFGGRVRPDRGAGHLRGERRDADDAATVAEPHHLPRTRLYGQEHTGQVHVELVLPVFQRQL